MGKSKGESQRDGKSAGKGEDEGERERSGRASLRGCGLVAHPLLCSLPRLAGLRLGLLLLLSLNLLEEGRVLEDIGQDHETHVASTQKAAGGGFRATREVEESPLLEAVRVGLQGSEQNHSRRKEKGRVWRRRLR